jgi:organic hydroperoxide reductase OsmC/OhrA
LRVQIAAAVKNTGTSHEAWVTTAGVRKPVPVQGKSTGRGSAVSGGEFLMLALATCFCNDIYREAGRLNIRVDAVEVEAGAEFAGVGLAASHITYRARISSPASRAEVDALLRQTDLVAEVHNTIRAGVEVSLEPWEVQR